MNVTTAIIFTAGYGSRMLPVTAAVQKELLPILDRPVVDYVVADAVKAGIKRIIFVIQPGSRGLQDYYIGNAGLHTHLARYHKHAAIEKLKSVHDQATFEFVEQPADAGYGTAVPVKVAAPHLTAGEAVLVCDGDGFLWHADGTSEIAALIKTFQSSDAAGAMMALERPDSELHRYGVLSLKQTDEAILLDDIDEKPAPGTAPSNLINISKYILTPKLLEYVTAVKSDPKLGEYLITDAIRAAAKTHRIAVHHAQGKFLDAGNVAGWLEANLTIAAVHPELKHQIKK